MYKILNGHTAPNLKEQSLFPIRKEQILTISEIKELIYYSTRQEVPHAQWNNLPHETKIADSLRSFKTILEQK
jgi:hypothetical protein